MKRLVVLSGMAIVVGCAAVLAAPRDDSEEVRKQHLAAASMILGRLSPFERDHVKVALGQLAAGKLSVEGRRQLTSVGCEGLMGTIAIQELSKTKSPAMKWAAQHLRPRQANMLLLGEDGTVEAFEVLHSGRGNVFDAEAVEKAIGPNELTDKYYATQADPAVAAQLAEAIAKSEEIENQTIEP